MRSAAGSEAGDPAFVGLAFLLSFAVSMVAFIFPSGLGVREGVFALALAQNCPARLAVALSVGVRLMLTLVELVFIGIVFLSPATGERRPPPPGAPRVGDDGGLLGVVFAYLAVARHRAFWTGRFDLGNMVQAVWSTAHGRPLETTDVTGDQFVRLGAHVDPILVLFTPLAWTGFLPEALLVAQVLIVASGALPAFWLGRRWLGTPAWPWPRPRSTCCTRRCSGPW